MVRIACIGVAAIAICGGVTMSLWNWLAPALFHLPAIGFWQALGLLILTRLLFGGFGGGRGRHRGTGPRMAWGWELLSPEEKERFLRGVGHRCAAPGDAQTA